MQTLSSRRLIRDGKTYPLYLSSGGGSRLFSWNSFVLFNDCFVHLQVKTSYLTSLHFVLSCIKTAMLLSYLPVHIFSWFFIDMVAFQLGNRS